MLLDANIFSKIFKGNVKPSTLNNSLIAVDTILCWVSIGNVGSVSSLQFIGNSMLSANDVPIDTFVRRF